MKVNDPFVEIATLRGSFEAAFLQSSLERRGVQFRIFENRDSAFGGLFGFGQDWGTIFAPEACRDIVICSLVDFRTKESSSDRRSTQS